jgi:diketogulonate reductase-like aldo/keto reductase
VPLSETIKAFEELMEQGKIRAMGVSNFDVLDMEEALHLATKPIACNQILYNLQTRAPEKQLIPFCKQRGIAVVSYTPFAQQRLPGKGTTPGDILHEIAEMHEATVSQVILAFLVRDSNVFTIPKAAHKDHVLDNAKAGDLRLSLEEIEAISTAFPAPRRSVPLQTL